MLKKWYCKFCLKSFLSKCCEHFNWQNRYIFCQICNIHSALYGAYTLCLPPGILGLKLLESEKWNVKIVIGKVYNDLRALPREIIRRVARGALSNKPVRLNRRGGSERVRKKMFIRWRAHTRLCFRFLLLCYQLRGVSPFIFQTVSRVYTIRRREPHDLCVT